MTNKAIAFRTAKGTDQASAAAPGRCRTSVTLRRIMPTSAVEVGFWVEA
jgi:hypothetical protein